MKLKTILVFILTSSYTRTSATRKSNASECNFRGTYEDGECHCTIPFIGRNCEINISTGEVIGGQASCRETSDSAICSGMGKCVHGACSCHSRDNPNETVSGQYCECSNFLCDRHNGLLCGGPERGECVCNQCHCKPGWGGDDCTCQTSNENCINPDTGSICSDYGTCECNRCKCPEGRGGRWCQACPTCGSRCSTLKQCVHCRAFGGFSCQLTADEFSKCDVDIRRVSQLGVTGPDERLCRFFDHNDCGYMFMFNSKLNVPVTVTDLECPLPSHPRSFREGRYECKIDQEYTITSEVQREELSSLGKKFRWTIAPYGDHEMEVHCPFIEIPYTPNCKQHMLIVSKAMEHRKAEKLCGKTELVFYTNEELKITFRSNDSSARFACKVSCAEKNGSYRKNLPDPAPASLPSTPIVVSACADLDEKFAENCKCYNCDGHISLHCNVCNEEELNVFKAFDFRIDIELEIRQNCGRHLNLTGKYGMNPDKITALKMCVHDTIHLDYSELGNLQALAFQDCRQSNFYICQFEQMGNDTADSYTPGKREVSPGPPSVRFLGSRTELPSPSEVPNLVQLSLMNVDLTLEENLLSFPRLKRLSVTSKGGIVAKSKAFVGLPQLEVLHWKSCQETFESKTFQVTEENLRQLTIQDDCLHWMAPDAISFVPAKRGSVVESHGQKLTLEVKLNPKFYDHIPMCPFRPLLDLDHIELIWLTEMNCRSCGGIWYWELTPSQSRNVNGTCFDPVSNSVMSIIDYAEDNQKLCTFLTGHEDACN